jgi:hypothetical protein
MTTYERHVLLVEDNDVDAELQGKVALASARERGFVSGYDFSRARKRAKKTGLSPCLSLPRLDLFRRLFSRRVTVFHLLDFLMR